VADPACDTTAPDRAALAAPTLGMHAADDDAPPEADPLTTPRRRMHLLREARAIVPGDCFEDRGARAADGSRPARARPFATDPELERPGSSAGRIPRRHRARRTPFSRAGRPSRSKGSRVSSGEVLDGSLVLSGIGPGRGRAPRPGIVAPDRHMSAGHHLTDPRRESPAGPHELPQPVRSCRLVPAYSGQLTEVAVADASRARGARSRRRIPPPPKSRSSRLGPSCTP